MTPTDPTDEETKTGVVDLFAALKTALAKPATMDRCPDCYDGGACMPGGCGVDDCPRCGKVCPTCKGSCEIPRCTRMESGGT